MSKRRLTITWAALSAVLLLVGRLPARADRADPWIGQHVGSAAVRDLLAVWQFAWFPSVQQRDGVEIETDLYSGTKTVVRVGRRFSISMLGELNVVDRIGWVLAHETADPALGLEPEIGVCGRATVTIRRHKVAETERDKRYFAGGLNITTFDRPDLDDYSAMVGQPRCGKRMVESFERAAGATSVTCVDRAYEGAASLSQIVVVLEKGLVSWVMSPAPFAGDPIDDAPDDKRSAALWWPVPAACHPLFAQRTSRELGLPERNVAIAFDWVDDRDLLSLQAWQDDSETGYFVLLHADGRPATIGYRFEGLAHGLWYYLAPDSTLVEARLYALGVEIERLPVRTITPPR